MVTQAIILFNCLAFYVFEKYIDVIGYRKKFDYFRCLVVIRKY